MLTSSTSATGSSSSGDFVFEEHPANDTMHNEMLNIRLGSQCFRSNGVVLLTAFTQEAKGNECRLLVISHLPVVNSSQQRIGALIHVFVQEFDGSVSKEILGTARVNA